MRATLDIDDDVLDAAKEIAAARGVSAGRVLSELARKALAPPESPRVRNGVLLMPSRAKASRRPTLQVVNRLRDG